MKIREFKVLFEYLDNKFSKIDERFEVVLSDISSLRTTVDNLAKKVDLHHQEFLVITFQNKIEIVESDDSKITSR